MSERQAAFGHHFHEISETELVSQIPAHAENDDLPLEMAALEKLVDAQHQNHPAQLTLPTMPRSPPLHQSRSPRLKTSPQPENCASLPPCNKDFEPDTRWLPALRFLFPEIGARVHAHIEQRKQAPLRTIE